MCFGKKFSKIKPKTLFINCLQIFFLQKVFQKENLVLKMTLGVSFFVYRWG